MLRELEEAYFSKILRVNPQHKMYALHDKNKIKNQSINQTLPRPRPPRCARLAMRVLHCCISCVALLRDPDLIIIIIIIITTILYAKSYL